MLATWSCRCFLAQSRRLSLRCRPIALKRWPTSIWSRPTTMPMTLRMLLIATTDSTDAAGPQHAHADDGCRSGRPAWPARCAGARSPGAWCSRPRTMTNRGTRAGRCTGRRESGRSQRRPELADRAQYASGGQLDDACRSRNSGGVGLGHDVEEADEVVHLVHCFLADLSLGLDDAFCDSLLT